MGCGSKCASQGSVWSEARVEKRESAVDVQSAQVSIQSAQVIIPIAQVFIKYDAGRHSDSGGLRLVYRTSSFGKRRFSFSIVHVVV